MYSKFKSKWISTIKKGIASLICVSILFGSAPISSFATTNNSFQNHSIIIEQSSDKQETLKADLYNSDASTRSWQSFLSKKVAKACAKGLRKGMKSKFVRRMVTKYWDDATAVIFFQYADGIVAVIRFFTV